jgi:hypothetical protein
MRYWVSGFLISVSAVPHWFNTDPDPAFYLNADPDPGCQTNANLDPDPGQNLPSQNVGF